MEQERKSKLLLASAVIGFVHWISICIFIRWFILEWAHYETGFFEGLSNLFQNFSYSPGWALFMLWLISSFVVLIAAVVFNILAWLKKKNNNILISGLLYIFGLNLFSATICFVEYFNEKNLIKNKLLLYTALFSMVFVIIFIILFTIGVSLGPDGANPEYGIFLYIFITISIGVVFNLLAWKNDNKKLKIFAGVFYILGIFTVASAIICFISGRKKKEITA